MRRWHLSTLVSAALLLTLSKGVQAATFSFDKSRNGTPMVSIEGEINFGDEKKFNEAVARYQEAIILLASNGGNTSAAIKIGETIRLKGFATFVLNGLPCNSSCALIWLAGSPRALSKSAAIGFHATYVSVSGRDQESGLGNAIVGRYLTLLNLPERAVIFATSAAPSKLNYLTSANLTESGIDAKVIDDVPDDDEGTQPSSRPARSEAIDAKDTADWSTVGSWRIVVDNTVGGGCFMMAIWNGGTALRVGFDPSSDMKSYVMVGNDSWASLAEGSEYKIQFKFGDKSPWDILAKVITIGTGRGKFLYRKFNDEEFWADLRTAKTLSIFYNKKMINLLELSQSNAAFAEMLRCQKEQLRPQKDPFAR